MAGLKVVYINDSSNKTIVGIINYDRANGGVFIPPAVADATARNALTANTGELVWQEDVSSLYRWNGATWDEISPSLGSIDHGTLSGLGDDDHTQYLLADGTRSGASSQAQDFGVNGILTREVEEDAAGEGVVIRGIRYFGNLASPPTGFTGSLNQGDRYYDTTIEEEMFYDATRTKWLSVAKETLGWGRDGTSITAGTFLKMFGNVVTGVTLGQAVESVDLTITEFYWNMQTAVTTTFEVGTATTVVGSVPTGGSAQGGDRTVDFDFSIGDEIKIRNAPGGSGGATIDNPQGRMVVRIRRT